MKPVKPVKALTIGVLLALSTSVAIAQNNAAPAATGPTMASAGTDSLAVAQVYGVVLHGTGRQPVGSGEPFMIRLAFTPQGELAGFAFNPRSQAPTIDP